MVTQEMKHGLRLAGRFGGFLLDLILVAGWDFLFENGEIAVEWPLIVATTIAGLLCLYLFVALLKPEWFS